MLVSGPAVDCPPYRFMRCAALICIDPIGTGTPLPVVNKGIGHASYAFAADQYDHMLPRDSTVNQLDLRLTTDMVY